MNEEKGRRGGLCNRGACLAPGAYWYNRGSLAWYCEKCALMINKYNTDCEFEDGKPMCIPVQKDLSDDKVFQLTRFAHIKLIRS